MIKMQELIIKEIEFLDTNYNITIAGSFRRGALSSGDIDVLITHPNYTSLTSQVSSPAKKKSTKTSEHGELLKVIVKHLEKKGFITDTMAFGDTKFMGVCRLDDEKPYRRIDLRLIPNDQYYCGILYFTGSDLFNKNMRAIALEKDFTLNEYSLRKIGTTGIPGKPLTINSEKDVFDYLEMDYKKPEERNM
jgi:DNA polymerase beta